MFQIGYEGEGRYELIYSVNPTGGKWEPIFSVAFVLPVGGVGAFKESAKMLIPATPESRSTALLMARMFIVPEDLGTPTGAVTLRGAWNFQTPPGWDTVYSPIFNMIERPVAPMLAIRVETDWYAHETEFRYVLQPGETISASHSLPIGQVFFVPREEITLRDGTEEEAAARLQSGESFFREKVRTKLKTSYGLEYSPHYLRTSRARNATPGKGTAEMKEGGIDPQPMPDTALPVAPEKAENDPLSLREPSGKSPQGHDPCPCGSGRKFAMCHG